MNRIVELHSVSERERCYNRCGQAFSVSTQRGGQNLILFSCTFLSVPPSFPTSLTLSSVTSYYLWSSTSPQIVPSLTLTVSILLHSDTSPSYFVCFSSHTSCLVCLYPLSLFLCASLLLFLSAAVSHTDLHIFNSN